MTKILHPVTQSTNPESQSLWSEVLRECSLSVEHLEAFDQESPDTRRVVEMHSSETPPAFRYYVQ